MTTKARAAAATATCPPDPQCTHVAHRFAASYINRNTQHDRRKAPNGGRNFAANAIAQTSAQDEVTVDFSQNKR